MQYTVLSWNCRGAKSKPFHLHLKELIHTYKPTILALLETKINSKDSVPYICKYSYFNKFVYAEAIGFAGCIWLFWDDTVINLEIATVDDQIIIVIVLNQVNIVTSVRLRLGSNIVTSINWQTVCGQLLMSLSNRQ